MRFYIEKKLHGAKRFTHIEEKAYSSIDEATSYIKSASQLYDYRVLDIKTNLRSPIMHMGKESKKWKSLCLKTKWVKNGLMI